MNDEEPKTALTLDQSVKLLSTHRAEWLMILAFIDSEREQFMGNMRASMTPFDCGMNAGSVATLTELKSMLTPEGWV